MVLFYPRYAGLLLVLALVPWLPIRILLRRPRGDGDSRPRQIRNKVER